MMENNATHFVNGNCSDAPLTRLSPGGYVTAGVILALIALLGIVNNLAVIIIIARNRALRTPVNLVLLNLSISDLVLASLGAPFTAGAAFSNRWIYGRSFCVVYGFAMATAGIGSITSLAAVSVERYLLVVHSGKIKVTQKMTVLILIGIWLYTFLVTFPPVIGWNEYDLESPFIACSMNWENLDYSSGSYIVYLFLFGLVVPLTVILYAYYRLLHVIQETSSSSRSQAVAKVQGKITRMIAVMVGAFLVAWMPYTVVSLLVLFGGSRFITASAAAAPALLAKSSVIYNPIIYVFMNPQVAVHVH